VSASGAGALVGAAVLLAATPYLARLTLTVPDRELRRWWTGASASPTRTGGTALVAVVLGALGGASAGWSALLPAFLWLALTGAPLTVIDFEHHRLPNRLIYAAAVGAAVLLALAALVRHDWTDYLRAIEGAAAVSAVLFAVYFIAPGSFGRGDVRLGGVLGAYLGWSGWVPVYYGILGGFVLGSLVAIALLATRKASMKTALAFGPMLLFGALLVLAFDLSSAFVSN
jgi:leader peptidase (prepilin peptidase)/N-methyltransferase